MRRWVVLTIAATALGGGAIAGCMIFTGSTDGFVEADGGDSGVATVDGACLADGGFCLELQCTSTAECKSSADGGDAAAEVCCLGLVGENTIGTACEVDTCAFGTIQACASNAECSDGTSCVLQSCNYTSNHLEFSACGLLPGCALVVPGSADGGGPDSGATDSGNPDTGATDSGKPDSGVTDSGTPDTGITDANSDSAG